MVTLGLWYVDWDQFKPRVEPSPAALSLACELIGLILSFALLIQNPSSGVSLTASNQIRLLLDSPIYVLAGPKYHLGPFDSKKYIYIFITWVQLTTAIILKFENIFIPPFNWVTIFYYCEEGGN